MLDEARQAGRDRLLPMASEDYFHDMEWRGRAVADEIKGRNMCRVDRRQ
jgi:hypothetical protein